MFLCICLNHIMFVVVLRWAACVVGREDEWCRDSTRALGRVFFMEETEAVEVA